MAFIILASPRSAVLLEYKTALLAKKQNISSEQECWPSGSCKIKDTALALLALDHLGENTEKAEKWLLSKNKTATDILWLLQEDSESETKCTITYDQVDYQTTISADKKIGSPAGSCLTIYSNNFWFQVATSCYDKEFTLSCDKNFLANFLYKRAGTGNVYYVDSNTKSSPALGDVTLNINSKCFGLSNCEYEDSLWASLALFRKGYDVNSFIPYLIALSDSNEAYFPEAFLYILTGFEDYANKLIQEQNLGNYWQTTGSPNGKYYDTALALLSLSNSNAEQVVKAKKRMEKYQDSNGCWASSKTVRDTAILLWVLAGREPSIQVVPSVTRCLDANYFCMEQTDCGVPDRLGENYWCSGNQECCRVQNLETCTERNGQKCPSSKTCSGITIETSDEPDCCLLDCVDPVQQSECEANSNYCQTACASNQESTTEQCNGGMLCCKYTTPTPTPNPGGSKWWIWLIVIGIIILLAIIAFLQREKIKMWWFKKQSNVRSGSASPGNSFGGFRPGPPFMGRPGGFTPTRPMMNRPMPIRPGFTPARPINQPRLNPEPKPEEPNNSEEDETFKKLREMSKG